MPRDYAQAFHWYELAAAQGDATAENALGLLYDSGRGTAQDEILALHWFQLSAAQGNAYAENNVGYIYDTGRGVEAVIVRLNASPRRVPITSAPERPCAVSEM